MNRTPQDGKVLLEQARAAVARPLRFGDDEQIKARQFLADVDALYRHMRDCTHCLNWSECPKGYNMTGHFDVDDAAWALIEADGGEQGIAEAKLASGEAHL